MLRKMMKRQRPASPDIPGSEEDNTGFTGHGSFPPPSSSSLASSGSAHIDTNDIAHRSAKRQRVLPPSLDGPSRGWVNPLPSESVGSPRLQSNSGYEEDEEDDDYFEDAGADEEGEDGEDKAILQGATMKEYKGVNSLLHDLHAEQQHRRVMTTAPGSSSWLSPPLHPSHTNAQHLFHSRRHDLPGAADSKLTPAALSPARLRSPRAHSSPHLHRHRDQYHSGPPKGSYVDAAPLEKIETETVEEERVRQRYEDMNKSVFLLRPRPPCRVAS